MYVAKADRIGRVLKMKINSIEAKNFKGCPYGLTSFKDKTLITGRNASGKSTIIDSFFWVLTNKDFELSEPLVMPIGNELSATEVTLNVEIDSREHSIKKIQTREIKGENYATSNSFEVDSIPLNQTKFKETLKDFGIDVDMLLATSNPNYFFKLSKDSKRDILIGMATSVKDSAIASQLGFGSLAKELKDFSTDSIKARETANKKSFEKQAGKDNCLINAKIDALENAKAKLVASKTPKKYLELIDEDIKNLKDLRLRSSQNIADCERILSQIEKVEAEHIRSCEKEINSNFENIYFKLWETNQSGDIKPCCIPIIDGYAVGNSANTSRELLAKVSIMNGISEFYKVDYPMILDNCECLDKTYAKAVKSNRQIVMASVSNTALKIN